MHAHVPVATPPVSDFRQWSAAGHAPDERRDAWQEQLDTVYGGWALERPLDARFDAGCRHRGDAGFRIAECQCSPCAARHLPARYGDAPELFGLQLVLAGSERVAVEDERCVAGAGDVLLWDTRRPMRFDVPEHLHKFSVLLPLARLRDWLPAGLPPRRHFARGSTEAELLGSFVRALAPAYLSGALPHAEGLSEAAIGLVVNVLAGRTGAASPRELQLQRVQAYVAGHLSDPALSPQGIARANGISLRSLHALFEAAGSTPMQYLIRQRLARGHRELGNPRLRARKIADIAWSCGFQNATHFARRYREQYGLSPQQYRESLVDEGR